MEHPENTPNKSLPQNNKNLNDYSQEEDAILDKNTNKISEDDSPPLTILYRDDHYIAILKPVGFLVHKTSIAEHQKKFVLQKLRNQIKHWVYPIHRLDGPTTGVLVFGLHKKAASKLSELFRKRNIKKTYYALVRGHTPDTGVIDHPIQKHGHQYSQNAVSKYVTVAKGILPIAKFGYKQLYYSLVRVQPHTGRMHQIRKHLKHINCPIICDRRYGDWRHNKLFDATFGISNLFLLAKKLEFIHPYTKEPIKIEAPFSEDILQIAANFGWDIQELEKREQEGSFSEDEN